MARRLIADALRELGGAPPAAVVVRAALRIHGKGMAGKHAPADAVHEGPPHGDASYARAFRALGGRPSLTRDHGNRAA